MKIKKILIHFSLTIIFILLLAIFIKAQQFSLPVTVIVREVFYEIKNLILGYGSGKGSSDNYNISFILTEQPVGSGKSDNYNITLGSS